MAGLLEFSTTYKPFMYPWAMNIAEEHEKIHWGTWEAKLQEDVNTIGKILDHTHLNNKVPEGTMESIACWFEQKIKDKQYKIKILNNNFNIRGDNI